jgi:SAM-dependent methyltransferase
MAQTAPALLTEIEEAPVNQLARSIKEALNKALVDQSDIDPEILGMIGMSGVKYRHLINNLIRGLDRPRYLEVGCWAGSTLCSAVSFNGVRATGVDNWSEFGGPKDQFLANIARYTTPGAHVNFIESDFRKIDFAALGGFNVYLFDGPHEYQDQYDGLALALPAMDKQFIFIVDDWNWEKVRLGTFGAIRALDINVSYSLEIRTHLGNKHVFDGSPSDWHNGYFIAVLEKP